MGPDDSRRRASHVARWRSRLRPRGCCNGPTGGIFADSEFNVLGGGRDVHVGSESGDGGRAAESFVADCPDYKAVSHIWSEPDNGDLVLLQGSATLLSDQVIVELALHDVECATSQQKAVGAGESTQVTSVRGRSPRLSPDSRFLFFSRRQGNAWGLWRRDINSGEEKRLFDGPADPRIIVIAQPGVYFVTRPDEERIRKLCSFNLGTRETQELTELPWLTTGGMALSPDQRTLFYTESYVQQSDLMLVENIR
jgi:hypothetical protein